MYACVDQISHFLTVLINRITLLNSEEEVGDLCTFTFDDSCEDAVKVLEVDWSEARRNTTVKKNQLWIIDAWVLNEDVAWVEVAVDKVVDKQLKRKGEGGK